MTDSAADRAIALDAASGAVRRTVDVGDEPVAIAVGLGSVWVVNRSSGTVSRIDDDSVSTIAVGQRPVDIAIDADAHAVWVASAGKAS